MATLWISEYSELAVDALGRVMQLGKEPAVAEQAVTYSTTAQSTAFNSRTRFIFVKGSTTAHISFGVSPVATASSKKISTEGAWFGVTGGQPTGIKLAVYDGSS